MIRKHNRRAAKAAFAIALGVALVLGGAAAAPAAHSTAAATPIILGTKDFPEEFILGQLYKQALEAKGFKVTYKENIGGTELIDKALRATRSRCTPSTRASRWPSSSRPAAEDRARDVEPRQAALRPARPDHDAADALPGQGRDRVLRATATKYGLKTVGDLKKVPT